jgi:hypothetical protein
MASPRFGYRRIHDMLRQEFPGVNHKRVYRLYRQANLTGASPRAPAIEAGNSNASTRLASA